MTNFNFPGQAYGYVPGAIPSKMVYSEVQPENPVEGLFWVDTSESNSGDIWLFSDLNESGISQWSLIQGKTIKSIASATLLRLYKGKFDGEVVNLVSYDLSWKVSDSIPFGGGFFVWNSTSTKADDSGTVFAVSGVSVGRWIRQNLNSISTDMFGKSPALAAAAYPNKTIRVNAGSYNLTSNLFAYWELEPGVTLTGSGRLLQPERGFWSDTGDGSQFYFFRDRVFVGDACDASLLKIGGANKSWVGYSAGGFMTYFDTRSQQAVYSTIGGVGVAAASRSSDCDRVGEENCIGVAAYVKNDKNDSSQRKAAWALYGHAVHETNEQFTCAIETDTCSLQPLTKVSPYLMGAQGTTAGYWLGVGGETAQKLIADGSASLPQNVSAALAVINSAGAAPENRFNKGIVFQASALAGTNGTGTGQGIAMEVARGHVIQGKYNAADNSYAGQIIFDGGTASTSQSLYFGNNQLVVRGFSSDISSTHPLLAIQAPTIPPGQQANWFFFGPTVAGTGSIQTQAVGPDANIIYVIQGKGSSGVALRDGAGSTKFSINSAGVGFYGAVPVGKPNVTGARGGNAALTELLVALSNLGLITNATSS